MIRKLPRWVWLGGIVLTFAAGMINAVALMSFTNKAATHVTGSITQAANAIVLHDLQRVWNLASVVLSFFLGAILSGIITQGSRLKLSRRYGVAMIIESLLLLASIPLFSLSSFWGQLLASLACGLQNGMVTTFSGAVIRTTHMTGILTDLGSKIGHWLTGSPMDKLRFLLYLLLFTGFITGSLAGALSFTTVGYYTLAIPASITGFGGLFYIIHVMTTQKHHGYTETLKG